VVRETAVILVIFQGFTCRHKAIYISPYGLDFGVNLKQKKVFCDVHITKTLFSL